MFFCVCKLIAENDSDHLICYLELHYLSLAFYPFLLNLKSAEYAKTKNLHLNICYPTEYKCTTYRPNLRHFYICLKTSKKHRLASSNSLSIQIAALHGIQLSVLASRIMKMQQRNAFIAWQISWCSMAGSNHDWST